MTNRKNDRTLSHDELDAINQRYDIDELRFSTTCGDAGSDLLWGRFSLAVGNQIELGDATPSRYAIWANTVRDNIANAIELMKADEMEEAKRLMVRAINSLSTFSDVQAYIDPFGLGETQ